MPLLTSFLLFTAMNQGVSPQVAKFIEDFSYAATRVDLKPDKSGTYPHAAELAKSIVALDKTSTDTLRSAFILLDKNESQERLVAGELLLILAYEIPKDLDWSKPDNADLRTPLETVLVSGQANPNQTSPTWPWIEDNGRWRLGPYQIARGSWDKSLTHHLAKFDARFKRRLNP
jgi:hypothetical protein